MTLAFSNVLRIRCDSPRCTAGESGTALAQTFEASSHHSVRDLARAEGWLLRETKKRAICKHCRPSHGKAA